MGGNGNDHCGGGSYDVNVENDGDEDSCNSVFEGGDEGKRMTEVMVNEKL